MANNELCDKTVVPGDIQTEKVLLSVTTLPKKFAETYRAVENQFWIHF